MTITITLSEERALQLKERADKAGVSPEELLQSSVNAWLARPEKDFAQAAAYARKPLTLEEAAERSDAKFANAYKELAK